MEATHSAPRRNFWPTVLAAGLLAGTLDISCALISYVIRTHKDPIKIFYYIAAAVFGKSAADGGAAMVIAGGVIHYLIAGTFTVFFFLVYPRLRFLSWNPVLTAILYGAFVWSVMNLIMLPYVMQMKVSYKPEDIAIGMGILIIAIGLPLAFIARRYYGSRSLNR